MKNDCSQFLHVYTVFNRKLIYYKKNGYNKRDFIEEERRTEFHKKSQFTFWMVRVFKHVLPKLF